VVCSAISRECVDHFIKVELFEEIVQTINEVDSSSALVGSDIVRCYWVDGWEFTVDEKRHLESEAKWSVSVTVY
jgi:hypothetical protein